LPVCNIVPISIPMADRYVYLPSVGFFGLIAIGFNKLIMKKENEKKRRKILQMILTLVCALSIITIARNKIWKNDRTFWSSINRYNPRNVRAISALAMLEYSSGNVDEAIELGNHAIKINPRIRGLYVDLATFYSGKKDYNKAEKLLIKAMEIDDRNTDAYFNMGVHYLKWGPVKRAVDYFTKVTELRPYDLEAHNFIAVCYAEMQEYDKARQKLEYILSLNPTFEPAIKNLNLLKQNVTN